MEQLVLFLIFYFLLCYDGKEVSGLRIPLKSQTADSRSTLAYPKDPDTERNVSQLITSKGYPVEEHTVQTDDGYRLSLMRIPHGKDANCQNATKRPVLCLHGDMSDAVQFVFDTPSDSLGYILADSCYDVWLLNNRGSRYSKTHVKYTTNDDRFWNYSFDELGKFDLPAAINYTLDATHEDSLYLIGHSRGGSEAFAMLSEMPDYNKKVRLFVAIAPATFLSHMTSPIRYLVPFADELVFGLNLVTHGEFTPDNAVTRKIKEEICGAAAPDLYEFFLFAIGGADKAQLNETRLGVYAHHYPTSTSTRSLHHYAQLIETGKFRKFDFGKEDNLKYYHQEEPPDYNLASITAKVALFWTANDKLVDPRDMAILRKHLNSVVFNYRVRYRYSHFDFTTAKNAPEMLYQPILQCLSKY